MKGINTKEKMKQKKKNQMLNFSFLRVRKLRLLLVSISLASLGVYTPMFYVVSSLSVQISEQNNKLSQQQIIFSKG